MKKYLKIMKNLNENKNGKVVTFDFDNTLVFHHEMFDEEGDDDWRFGGINQQMVATLKKFQQKGYSVIIVTARRKALEKPRFAISTYLDKLDIDVPVFYTEGQLKAQKLYELGSSLHFDDCPKEHEGIVAFRQLHDDFDIVVKYPDEGLQDTDNVSKGFVKTSDDRLIILKRADTGEWDVPGGHCRSGETPNYGFFREVREEIGFQMVHLQYIESQEFNFKGKDETIHYFLGRTNYSSDELDGVLQLDHENTEYYVHDIEHIMIKAREGATQLLKRCIDMYESDAVLEESYTFQRRMKKGYAKKKKIMIGLGGAKSTGAKGLERVKDFSRAKSAPAGFGALEEEPEEKRKIKIKITSDLDEKKKKRKKKKKKSKKRRSKVAYWPYGGYYDTGSSDGSFGDGGGGDGGGGE
tara:strand:- start:32 stop:1261 length:1230 start_codon:yes stop_codon:yes gene_type:complete